MSNSINNFQFTFTDRVAPLNGTPSSEMWNDTMDELAHDLANILQEWNNKMVPAFATIPTGSLDTLVNAYVNGIDGANLWVQYTSATGERFYNDLKSRPNTVREQFNLAYDYIDAQIAATNSLILATSSGLTDDEKNSIGINIFDDTQTSTSSSLDGKSENNRLNITQIARDMYGSGFTLDNDGAANLATANIYQMLSALLVLHNTSWDNATLPTHTGSFTAIQTNVDPSVTVDDSFTGSTTNLEDDLNEIRTLFKQAKGTTNWDDTLSALYTGGADSVQDLFTSTKGSGTKTGSNPWGYQYDNIDGLVTRLTAIQNYTGQDSLTDSTPDYSSLNFVVIAQSLESSISTLDHVVGIYVTSSGTMTVPSGVAITGEATFGSDLDVVDSGRGVILRSPNGSKWRITIDDSGSLTTTAL